MDISLVKDQKGKKATNVILHQGSTPGYPRGRPSSQARPPSPVVTPNMTSVAVRTRISADLVANRGFPSPKSGHIGVVRQQRRSPYPDVYRDEHQTWLSLSENEHNQSTDAEQQSMLASVLEPETHHKLKKLVEDQKHRPSSKNAVPISTPTKTITEDREEHFGADDDGAMSDRTQATAQLWAAQPPLDEGALQNASTDALMQLQAMLQREMDRRMVSVSVPNAIAHPTVHPPQAPVTPQSGFVDAQAVETRKSFKRTKSAGNDSAFNLRSRTPQPKTKSDMTAQVEKEDPELLSVNGDSLNTSHQGPLSAGRPTSRTNGVLHPNDKMLFGHRNTALPCLSPMDHAQSSPLDSVMLNSRSSSRPPSRGINPGSTLMEERLSTSFGGSQALGVHNLTIAAISAEGIIPIEAVNISQPKDVLPLDQFLASQRPHNRERETSRGEIVWSPSSAFDDRSVGSHSLNSSISSKQQRLRLDADGSGSPMPARYAQNATSKLLDMNGARGQRSSKKV